MRKSNLSVIVAGSFRIPMPVKEVVVFKNGGSFPKTFLSNGKSQMAEPGKTTVRNRPF